MKRFCSVIVGIILLVATLTSGLSFADNYITQQDIDAGLEFCKEYPVKLVLDGVPIEFSESDVPAVIINGRTLIPARALFESMGGTVEWNNDLQTVDIYVDEVEVTLTIGSNVAWVNGEAKSLEVPAMIIDHDHDYYGSTMIPVRFTAESLGCTVDWYDPDRSVLITSPGEEDEQEENEQEEDIDSDQTFWDAYNHEPLDMLSDNARQKLIAIDIGHGGKDTGAIAHEKMADELYEKTVNLKVGLFLRDYLRASGANLYMIRETDVYYTLLERADAANSRNAQLFVSIHNNSSDFDWPTGTEVHYYSKVDADGKTEKELYGIASKDVAEKVQSEMIKELGTFDRGIHSSPKLAVLNKTSMPAIIIEGAFLSNEENLAMIRTDEYAMRYAYAAAKGLIAILNETYP